MRHEARRVLIAVALFVVLAAGSVLAAGITETSAIPAGPLPASFTLAEARVGDSGVYVWDRVRVEDDGTVVVVNEHEILGFEWLAPGRAADATGARHDAVMLHQWGWQPTVHGADLSTLGEADWERYAEPVYAIELASDRILSYSYLSEATADPSAAGNTQRTAQRMFLEADDRFWPACGPDSRYSGRPVPLDEPVVLFRACMGFSNVLLADAHAPLRAVGTQMLGDRATLLLSSAKGDLHVWYDAEVPVPLRIAAAACDMHGTLFARPRCSEDTFDVLRLTSFRRGDVPLPPRGAASEPSAPAPAWALAPVERGLPSERDIEHPFPASAALKAALADPNGRALRDTLERGGYVSFLDGREVELEGGFVRSWDISATDGTSAVAVRVEQRIESAQPTQPSSPLPGLPPLQGAPPAGTTTRVIVESAPDRSGGPWPSPDQVPQEAPTVESMWARWRAFADDAYAGSQPNVWGSRILCLEDHRGHCTPYVERWAGMRLDRMDGAGSASMQSILSESDHEGRGHEMDMWEYTYMQDATGQPVSVQTRAADGELALIHSRAWIAPASPVVVRSALAAAIVSLAYLLWPAARTGAVAFYTRHSTPPDILRSGERQRMMQAVHAQPGISVQELARALGRPRSPTEHHLLMLRRVGLVRIERAGGKRFVYPCDAPAAMRPGSAELASDVARSILEGRRARPGASVRELARDLGVSPGTVSYHLARLRQAGLLAEG